MGPLSLPVRLRWRINGPRSERRRRSNHYRVTGTRKGTDRTYCFEDNKGRRWMIMTGGPPSCRVDEVPRANGAPLLGSCLMGKRRSDADYRRFFDEFLCVKIPRLRATGAVQLEAPHTIIQFGRRRKLIGLAHTKFRHGGSWRFFRCPKCGRRANRLWLIEDRPHCVRVGQWPRTSGIAPNGLRAPRTPESQRQGPRIASRRTARSPCPTFVGRWAIVCASDLGRYRRGLPH